MPCRCLVSIGSDDLLKSSSVTEAVVWEHSELFLGEGRNITLDNFFTSKSHGDRLLQQKTTIFGTIHHNRLEDPPTAKSIAGRTKGDTNHYYCDDGTLVSYWQKNVRPVLLYFPMHAPQKNIDGKGDTVIFYNETKGGVDTLDLSIFKKMFKLAIRCRDDFC